MLAHHPTKPTLALAIPGEIRSLILAQIPDIETLASIVIAISYFARTYDVDCKFVLPAVVDNEDRGCEGSATRALRVVEECLWMTSLPDPMVSGLGLSLSDSLTDNPRSFSGALFRLVKRANNIIDAFFEYMELLGEGQDSTNAANVALNRPRMKYVIYGWQSHLNRNGVRDPIDTFKEGRALWEREELELSIKYFVKNFYPRAPKLDSEIWPAFFAFVSQKYERLFRQSENANVTMLWTNAHPQTLAEHERDIGISVTTLMSLGPRMFEEVLLASDSITLRNSLLKGLREVFDLDQRWDLSIGRPVPSDEERRLIDDSFAKRESRNRQWP